MSTSSAQPYRPMTGWDRVAIGLLGTAGFALSYDALQQVAVAIHVRGSLSYLFPMVIDGFIAYGVRALVLLRGQRAAARAYAWVLFSAATCASIWANALHAIELNTQPSAAPSTLQLGDTVVGILSTLAPLALAGSVHLYILMARTVDGGPVPDQSPAHEDLTTNAGDTLQGDAGRPSSTPATAPAGGMTVGSGPAPTGWDRSQTTVTSTDAYGAEPTRAGKTAGPQPIGPAAGPVPGPGLREELRPEEQQAFLFRPGRCEGETGCDEEPASEIGPEGDRTDDSEGTSSETGGGRPPAEDELLSLARDATARAGRINRVVVADAVRAGGHRIRNERLGGLLAQLRQEADDKLKGQGEPAHAQKP